MLEETLRPAAHVETSIDRGTAVLLDMRKGRYLGLDEVGTRIWQLLAEGCDRGEIVDALGQVYDVERERLRTDVDAFLATCRRRRLLIEARCSPEA